MPADPASSSIPDISRPSGPAWCVVAATTEGRGTANTGGIAGDLGRMIKTPPYANAQDEENNAYWQSPLKSHVFDVPLKSKVAVNGVPPGRAMPIPYTAACGTCHVVNELPFR